MQVYFKDHFKYHYSSYILRRPQNFAKSSPYSWLQYIQSKVRWRFCKILWPSQNIWTLPWPLCCKSLRFCGSIVFLRLCTYLYLQCENNEIDVKISTFGVRKFCVQLKRQVKVDIIAKAFSTSVPVMVRWLLKFEFQLPHPILSSAFAPDKNDP